ncbi:MAG: EamA family transporter RarD [Burkholderiales bacterium]|nr:EamA family transporter RarD [Burkholderiales bacterium]
MPGLVQAALAYILWGLFPIYFHALSRVDALQIVLHRSVWCFVFVWGLLVGMRRLQWVAGVARQPRLVGLFTLSALLLTSNWLLYVWAVNHGHVVEASLGYFVTPLVNVLLGTCVLGERPRRLQWIAVATAACGVLWLTLTLGRPPWIALGLAASFGCYGLLRKTAPLGALEGLALETAVLAPVALVALALLSPGGLPGLFAGMDGMTVVWLLCAGPITAIPLLLFAGGARRITLATLGTLQYVSPTIQFLLGVAWFGEPLDPTRLAGFALIWAALAIYSADGFLWMRRVRAQAAA